MSSRDRKFIRGHRVRPRSALRAIAVITVIGGCFPINPLPPAIEPGLRFGLTATMAVTTRDDRADTTRVRPGVLPVLGAYLSTGRAALPQEPGVRVTVLAQWSGNVTADAYLEAPGSWLGSIDAGAGALIQRGTQDAWGPYLSVGRELRGGRYLWITQGATALKWPSDSEYRWVSGTLLGLQGARRRTARGAVFVGGVVGPQYANCAMLYWWACRHATRAYIGVSVGDVLPQRRAAPWPPRSVTK